MNIVENLDYYKVFYYVAKEGGITQAAKKLSVSQPAVSQIIRQLEQQLSISLFTRVGKGIRLTAEGEVLFSYVEKGYEQISQGVKCMESMRNMEKGEIHIGASDMTLRFFLLDYLEQFHEKYPNIKVSVTNAPTPDTLNSLEKGNIDFAVVSTPFLQKEEYLFWQVKEIQDVFVAGKRFLGLQGKEIEYQKLEKLPLICLEEDTSTRKYMDQYLAEKKVQITPEFELATSDMIVQFALRNLGIGCVVEDFAKESVDSGELFVLSFKESIPKRQMCVVHHKKTMLSNAAKHMLSLLPHEFYTQNNS